MASGRPCRSGRLESFRIFPVWTSASASVNVSRVPSRQADQRTRRNTRRARPYAQIAPEHPVVEGNDLACCSWGRSMSHPTDPPASLSRSTIGGRY